MTIVTHCLECGTELNATEASGLCPKCMLKLGLASQLASGTLPATARGLREDGTIVEPFDFGRYRVLRLLGKGGMGAVYEAEDRETQRRVALKVLGHYLDTAEMRTRFLREGQLAASVCHPNVVGVFHAHEVEKTPVIAMELVLDGTLRDRVRRKGQLPYSEAVDLVLQMIDGLEAAHSAGVLHRDIKPANCFVTPEGAVKIGDFGLSISTLARAESELTASGAVLGTPAFAAPEQLRGREVDVRADIYAVGATLYYLLTGRQTHEADSLVSLIAAVLEQTPREPYALRQDLPRALSQIVMRCLAKGPVDRPQTYDHLRRLLIPFSSAAPTPATLGLRLLAGVVDSCVAVSPAMIFMLVWGAHPTNAAVVERTPQVVLLMVAFWLLQLLYFAIPEWLWGASLGKALCALRVTTADRAAQLSFWRCFGRAVIFHVPDFASTAFAVATFTAAEYERILAGAVSTRVDAVMFGLLVCLFLTMRRRNGYAAVHDLLTGTRVVARPSPQSRETARIMRSGAPQLGTDLVGPYVVVERTGDLIKAWDEMLRRFVWIRPCAAGTPEWPASRREISRTTRLRWLAGERTDAGGWDAFEAPEGMPLTAYFDKAQPWSRLRFWLSDLAEELHVALGEGSLPKQLGSQHVWITVNGRAVLIDFPTPDAVPFREQELQSPKDVAAFLSRVAEGTSAPQIPLHAREFLDHLQSDRFDETAVIAANLRALVNRPATFSRQRRLFTIALPALLSAWLAIAAVFILVVVNRDFDEMWAKEYPGRPSLRQVLDIHSWNPGMSPKRRTRLANYVGSHYRDVVRDPSFWNRPETIAATDRVMRDFAEQAVAKTPQLSEGDLARNDLRIADELKEHAAFERWIAWISIPGIWLGLLVVMLVLGNAWILVGRAPLGMYLAGAAIVGKDGRAASRRRALLRSVPVLIAAGFGMQGLVLLFNAMHEGAVLVMMGVSTILLLVGAIWAVRRPERGFPDRIAGTYVVPR